MDRTTDEPDVVIEEYEEVVENLDELSDRVESEDAETESIQEPTYTHRSTVPEVYKRKASRTPRRVETGGCNRNFKTKTLLTGWHNFNAIGLKEFHKKSIYSKI